VSIASYQTGLVGTTALANMLDVIETEEGYGETRNGPGVLYIGDVGHPTIGFGFDAKDQRTKTSSAKNRVARASFVVASRASAYFLGSIKKTRVGAF
jgi:hypothetical protein